MNRPMEQALHPDSQTRASSMAGENRLIFLTGCQRSGTTLLQNMMDSHPDVVGGPEFLHLPDVVALRTKLLTSVHKGWIDLFCSAEEVDRHIRTLIERLLLPFLDRQGGRYLSEKSPQNTVVMAELIELFPEAKFVWIVRDPRAVIASMLAIGDRARIKGERPPPQAANLQAAIMYVHRCMKAGFKAVDSAPDKVHTIKYEALVNDPEAESKRLCEFLGLSWSEAMLAPGDQQHLGEAAITVNSLELWYDKQTYYSNPNTQSVEKWRTELGRHQQLLINRVFQRLPELKRFGYDFTLHDAGPLTSLAARLRSFAIRLRWESLRLLRQTVAE